MRMPCTHTLEPLPKLPILSQLVIFADVMSGPGALSFSGTLSVAHTVHKG